MAMAIQSFFVPGPTPGLNELIGAAASRRGGFSPYNKLKRQWAVLIMEAAKDLRPVSRGHFTFVWREVRTSRDPDNIAAGGRKLILDSLVTASVLSDDGWRQIAGWSDSFVVDKGRPGVEVTIDEVTG